MSIESLLPCAQDTHIAGEIRELGLRLTGAHKKSAGGHVPKGICKWAGNSYGYK